MLFEARGQRERKGEQNTKPSIGREHELIIEWQAFR